VTPSYYIDSDRPPTRGCHHILPHIAMQIQNLQMPLQNAVVYLTNCQWRCFHVLE